MESKPLGIQLLQKCCPRSQESRIRNYRISILLITFVTYMSYHLSRKPISIVKNSKQFLDCHHSGENVTDPVCSSWISAIDGTKESEAKTYLGLLDTTYLFSYAFFMFGSGFIAERMNLRYFLSLGMLMSGVLTYMFGLAYSAGIHSLAYLVIIQIICGMFQSTGWPGTVTVMGNWFGKGRRGLIFGIWNAHTSIGNILGSLIAGAFVGYDWGLSFIVPGAFIGIVGFIVFLFMAPHPNIVDLPSPEQQDALENNANDENTNPDNRQEKDHSKESLNHPMDSPQEEKAIGFFGALMIPGVLEFSFSLFFSKLVSYTFLYWLPNYIYSTSHVSANSAAILSTYFDYGGIAGGIFAGVLSDWTGMSGSTCGVMLVIAIPLMLLYERLVGTWCPISQVGGIPIHNSCYTWNILMIFATGILVNGPYCLITTAVSAELGTHPSLAAGGKALATVTAIIDGTGSIGAAIGPFLAGWLAGAGDWKKVFILLVVADVLSLLLLTRIIFYEIKNKMSGSSLRKSSDQAP